MRHLLCIFFVVAIFTFIQSCSSVKYTLKKGLPRYKTEKTYEASYAKVWAATYNVVAATADIEIAEESDGIIKTGWNYCTSDMNIAEYKIDDRKKYKPLKLRYRYIISLEKVPGGTKVNINSDQDFEELNSDNYETPSDSWISTKSSTHREHSILENIKIELTR